MHPNQNRVNRLALVFLSIIVLEMILISNQIQQVRAIKKKLSLRKVKKILPLLAFMRSKKKFLFLPIPIPLVHKQHFYPSPAYGNKPLPPPQQQQTFFVASANGAAKPTTVGAAVGPAGQPMSFMMVADEDLSQSPASMQVVPVSSSEPMLMPSMTMTIQPNGVELSASSRPIAPASTSSGALMQQASVKFSQHVADLSGFDQPGGEHYYSSPWGTRRPLASPAKLLRNVHSKAVAATRPTRPPPMAAKIVLVTTSAPPPQQQQVVGQVSPASGHVKASQWRPTTSHEVSGRIRDEQVQPPPPHSQQQHENPIGEQEVEHEHIVSVGPPQMIPIYQMPNGQLHATPPPPPSPAQQHHKKSGSTKRKPAPVVSGGY